DRGVRPARPRARGVHRRPMMAPGKASGKLGAHLVGCHPPPRGGPGATSGRPARPPRATRTYSPTRGDGAPRTCPCGRSATGSTGPGTPPGPGVVEAGPGEAGPRPGGGLTTRRARAAYSSGVSDEQGSVLRCPDDFPPFEVERGPLDVHPLTDLRQVLLR